MQSCFSLFLCKFLYRYLCVACVFLYLFVNQIDTCELFCGLPKSVRNFAMLSEVKAWLRFIHREADIRKIMAKKMFFEKALPVSTLVSVSTEVMNQLMDGKHPRGHLEMTDDDRVCFVADRKPTSSPVAGEAQVVYKTPCGRVKMTERTMDYHMRVRLSVEGLGAQLQMDAEEAVRFLRTVDDDYGKEACA